MGIIPSCCGGKPDARRIRHLHAFTVPDVGRRHGRESARGARRARGPTRPVGAGPTWLAPDGRGDRREARRPPAGTAPRAARRAASSSTATACSRAIVDGASRLRIYWSIVLPLSRPIIATVTILLFLRHWGQLLWPVMVARSEEVRPLTVAMQQFFGQQPREWGQIMAFAAMITVPVLIVYLLFNRWFVQSIASSGVKG
ncbi:MAG: carbohydrate ABC transporter permease [Trueperaceae bacterium]|nr:carbohydrate ABC transporter permease [Trueperaceae bacterium]